MAARRLLLAMGAAVLVALGVLALLREDGAADGDDAARAPASMPVAPRTADPAAVTPHEEPHQAARTAVASGRTLHAIVVATDGQPQAAADIELRTFPARAPAISASDGTLSWHGLQDGRYGLRSAGFEIDAPHVITVPSLEPGPVRIVVRRKRVLAGRVLDANDSGVRYVWVIAEDPSGVELATVITGAGGAFQVEAPAGQAAARARLWVHSGGRFAMAQKHEAPWGQLDVELRVHPAPVGTLVVVTADGTEVHDYRVWIDLAPAVRAASPWVDNGWIHGKPGENKRLACLGLVPQRLSIFPADPNLDCRVVDVPGGEACREVRVTLSASAGLLVRTEPPVAGAGVQVLRAPPGGSKVAQAAQPERMRINPRRDDEVVLVAAARTDASGRARVRGGTPGQAAVVCVVGDGFAGESAVQLAADGEIVVPVAPAATLDVVATAVPGHETPRTLALERRAEDGGCDALGRVHTLHFGGETDHDLLTKLRSASTNVDRQHLATRAVALRERKVLDELLADTKLAPELRAGLQAILARDHTRARAVNLPAGRYRIMPGTTDQRSAQSLAEFTLGAGERREQVVELGTRVKLDLKITLPQGPHRPRTLVDEGSGALCETHALRAGRFRLLATDRDGRLWLSRDVVTIPTHGAVDWTPVMAPMSVKLRLRTASHAPIAARAVSRVRLDDHTEGWHGQPMGSTDIHGEIELRASAAPFRLRVDGVGPLLGPFTPDARLHEQVIEVEIGEQQPAARR